jgi:acetylornithine deacetylase/succinyl-diaminopimelate desuccinylase-like protein
MIRGGKRKQAFYPTRSCEAVIEVFTLDPVEDVLGTVDELLSSMDGKVEVVDRQDMVRFDDSSSIAETMVDLTNKIPAYDILRTEAAIVAGANPRIVLYGPGEPAQICSEQEYVTVRDLEQTYEAILKLVNRSAEYH